MALRAINQEVLELFNNLLHDLYFEIPAEGFVAKSGVLAIDLFDKDFCIHRDFVARYHLCIHSVQRMETKGNLSILPGNEVELNEIQFGADKRQVSLVCVHPFQLICWVQELRITVDQID